MKNKQEYKPVMPYQQLNCWGRSKPGSQVDQTLATRLSGMNLNKWIH